MNVDYASRVKSLLERENFSFKKSLGQNFLTDKSVCAKMACLSADGDTGVLEIGPGAGILTKELSARAKKVVSLEIDNTLLPVLSKTLGGADNVKIIFNDILKTDVANLIKSEFSDCKRVTVCANLPYYITSKIIMYLLKSGTRIESLTVMVQKEVAERICAPVGSRKAGLFTAQVCYYASPELLFCVPAGSFVPSPKVDSAVIKLSVRKTPPVSVKNEEFFFNLLGACFAQRRKTLVNSVSSVMGADKQILEKALLNSGLDRSVRGEALSMQQLAEISDEIFRLLGEN